jgi:iron complex transport system ATP-binding protein
MDILASLKADGHNIVLITHNIHEINNVIERVIMLKNGKIVADGKKDEVLTEDNLTNTFDVEVGLKKINGNLLSYRKTILK